MSIGFRAFLNFERPDPALVEAYRDLPVFAMAATPLGPYREGPGEINVPVVCGGQVVLPGDILVGDSDGLVVISRHDAADLLEAVKKNLEAEQEDMEKMKTGVFSEAEHRRIFTGSFEKRGGTFHKARVVTQEKGQIDIDL